MNRVLNKIRRGTGIPLEALFILFIVTTSFSETSAQENTDQILSYNIADSNPILLWNSPTSISTSSSLDNFSNFDWDFSEFIIDLPAKVLLNHQLFSFGDFERNVFYVFNSASAP